MFEEFSYPV